MHKHTRLWLGCAVLGVAGMAALCAHPADPQTRAEGHAVSSAAQHHAEAPASPHAQTQPAHQDLSEKLAAALKSIDAARAALHGGDQKTALAELDKAKALIAPLLEAMGKPQPKYANTRCPIMGGAIDPAKVTESLVRQYKGQTVAFCCAACPPVWDGLTDEQKDAKLKAAVGAK